MPMSVVYTTVNGRLVEENRGGVVTRYIPDTLGNVIKTADVNGNITSETTYWPFGEVRTQVGTNPSPWGFCGIWGYLQDAAARLYVRARYLRADLGRWITVDPLWPGEPAYGYARNGPVTLVDASGMHAPSVAPRRKTCRVFRGTTGLHQFICVDIRRPDGSTRNCSGGLYSADGVSPIGAGKIGGVSHDCQKMEMVRYDLIVGGDFYRFCDFANAMCKCLDNARVNPRQYKVSNNKCYSFVGWAISI